MIIIRRQLNLALFIVTALVFWCAQAQAARVYIDIDQPFAKKLPIAIPDFVPSAGGTGGPVEFTQALPKKLADNLDLTGMFIALDKRSFLESDPRSGIGPSDRVNFREWAAIGSEFLVKGAYSLNGEQLTLDLKLFDVFDQDRLIGKRYTGHKSIARKMINLFTNEILKKLTGESGVFGSEICFVSGRRDSSAVLMTEFGGDAKDIRGVAGAYSEMPALSKSGAVAYISRSGYTWQLKVGQDIISSGELHVSPAFTPDGRVLASISGPSATHIFLFDGKGKGRQITTSGTINVSPSASPDGSRMAYASNQAGGAQIYMMPLGGGSPVRLTTEGKENTEPHWSPRGDRIVFVGESQDIYTMKADGTDLVQLTSGQGQNTHPTWSPDGRLIVFASTRFGRSQLFIMTANGERQQPLMPDYKGDQHSPYWGPAMPEESK